MRFGAPQQRGPGGRGISGRSQANRSRRRQSALIYPAAAECATAVGGYNSVLEPVPAAHLYKQERLETFCLKPRWDSRRRPQLVGGIRGEHVNCRDDPADWEVAERSEGVAAAQGRPCAARRADNRVPLVRQAELGPDGRSSVRRGPARHPGCHLEPPPTVSAADARTNEGALVHRLSRNYVAVGRKRTDGRAADRGAWGIGPVGRAGGKLLQPNPGLDTM